MASKRSVQKASAKLANAHREYIAEVLEPTAYTGYRVRELRDALSFSLEALIKCCTAYVRENG